jgi:hypothetical protein
MARLIKAATRECYAYTLFFLQRTEYCYAFQKASKARTTLATNDSVRVFKSSNLFVSHEKEAYFRAPVFDKDALEARPIRLIVMIFTPLFDWIKQSSFKPTSK